jgi:hypothetical protein
VRMVLNSSSREGCFHPLLGLARSCLVIVESAVTVLHFRSRYPVTFVVTPVTFCGHGTP